MKLDLTKDEVNALYELGRYALRSRESQVDPEAQDLASAVRKLREVAQGVKCVHCGGKFSRRKSRLCDACHKFNERNGNKPPVELLIRRSVSRRRVLD